MTAGLRRALLALAVCALSLLAPQAAQARWLKAETARFIVYSDGPERALRDHAARLEHFDALLRFFHGLDPAEVPPRKLEVYLLEDRRDLQRLLPGLSAGVAGFYRATLGDIHAAAVTGEFDEGEGEEVLFHEYVHHFMQQYFPSTYPGWLLEGYAEYFSTAEVNDARFQVGRWNTRREGQLERGGFPLRDLLAKPPSQIAGGQQRQGYYAQAWLLTHYMMAEPARRAQLAAYVRGLGAGQEPLAAWTGAVGGDLEDLDRRLDSYVRATKFTTYERQAAAPVAVTVTPMPASADQLLLEAQRLRSGVAKADAAAFVAEVRVRAAKFPGDRLARLTLARAETLHGDRAAGEAIAEAMLKADGGDLEALRIMAQSRLAAGAADPARRRELYIEAGRYLAKAHAIDPHHYQTLAGFAQSRSASPGYPTDNTLAILREAVVLAPQVDALRLRAGRALIRRQAWDEAAALLRPVAGAPHGGAQARLARRLLDKVEAGRAPAEAEDEPEG